MPDKPVKQLYHSEAVTFGPTQVFVKNGPNKSKFGADKPPYYVLDIGGRERNYTVENSDCEAALKSVVGRKTILEFTGSRDDAAIVVAGATNQHQSREPEPSDDPGKPPPDFQQQQNRQRTPAPKQESLPPAEQEVADLKNVRHYMMQQANLRSLALDCAVFTAKAHNKKHPEFPLSANDIRELSSVIYIGAERKGMVERMPTKPLPDDAGKGGAK